MRDSIECIYLQRGLIHCLAPADLVLEDQPGCGYPIITNCLCDQCSGTLGVLDDADRGVPAAQR